MGKPLFDKLPFQANLFLFGFPYLYEETDIQKLVELKSLRVRIKAIHTQEIKPPL